MSVVRMTNQTSPAWPTSFDLVRISRARAEVSLAPNTIRAYSELGLRLFKVGKVVFFSRTELTNLIVSGVLATAMKNEAKAKVRV